MKESMQPINLWVMPPHAVLKSFWNNDMGFTEKQLLPEPVGRKDDAEKLRHDLLDPWALEGLAAVLTFGANKYAAHNWRKGINNSRLVAAMERHLGAIKKGEHLDGESGLPHIDHLGCCWMFLSYNDKRRPDLDDMWKPN